MKVWKDYKNPKITADFMKIALSSYFRFKNQYKMVCTEFLLKDVIAYDMKDKFVEVEVKISMVDFHKDKQKPKHKKYLSTRTKKDKQPTLFYYAFPAEMYKEYKEEIIKQIDEINPKYGILVVDNINSVTCIRSAKQLHEKELTKRLSTEIIARLSSENINLRKKVYDFKQESKKEKQVKMKRTDVDGLFENM